MRTRFLWPLLPAILLSLLRATGAAAATAAGKERAVATVNDPSAWYRWTFALDDPTLGEIDLRFLLDPPAGKHGFVTVGRDGHLYFQDGTRARFFGTNVGGARCAPDRKTAEQVAERLARFGVNLLRLHTPDSRWAGLIDYQKGNTRTFNPDVLDRYDYFVAQLKQHGIYVYFDLLDYRGFLPGDGVRDAEQMGTRWEHSIKGASIFDRRMIELQKEFATQLLTHRNPYTGLRYVDEPALAIQEITNENSLFYLHNQKLMLPSYVEGAVFAMLLEASASEHAARRRAMKAATENAEELTRI
ncbi:MAG: F0F1 ATP synthase subunit gamma, partial [Armatimonadota bacterium]|nr:F0F1 ATP synthase subunit gamma [Armatimonadota bacterium]